MVRPALQDEPRPSRASRGQDVEVEGCFCGWFSGVGEWQNQIQIVAKAVPRLPLSDASGPLRNPLEGCLRSPNRSPVSANIINEEQTAPAQPTQPTKPAEVSAPKRRKQTEKDHLTKPLPKPSDPGAPSPVDDPTKLMPAAQWALQRAASKPKAKGKAMSGWAKGQDKLMRG